MKRRPRREVRRSFDDGFDQSAIRKAIKLSLSTSAAASGSTSSLLNFTTVSDAPRSKNRDAAFQGSARRSDVVTGSQKVVKYDQKDDVKSYQKDKDESGQGGDVETAASQSAKKTKGRKKESPREKALPQRKPQRRHSVAIAIGAESGPSDGSGLTSEEVEKVAKEVLAQEAAEATNDEAKNTTNGVSSCATPAAIETTSSCDDSAKFDATNSTQSSTNITTTTMNGCHSTAITTNTSSMLTSHPLVASVKARLLDHSKHHFISAVTNRAEDRPLSSSSSSSSSGFPPSSSSYAVDSRLSSPLSSYATPRSGNSTPLLDPAVVDHDVAAPEIAPPLVEQQTDVATVANAVSSTNSQSVVKPSSLLDPAVALPAITANNADDHSLSLDSNASLGTADVLKGPLALQKESISHGDDDVESSALASVNVDPPATVYGTSAATAPVHFPTLLKSGTADITLATDAVTSSNCLSTSGIVSTSAEQPNYGVASTVPTISASFSSDGSDEFLSAFSNISSNESLASFSSSASPRENETRCDLRGGVEGRSREPGKQMLKLRENSQNGADLRRLSVVDDAGLRRSKRREGNDAPNLKKRLSERRKTLMSKGKDDGKGREAYSPLRKARDAGLSTKKMRSEVAPANGRPTTTPTSLSSVGGAPRPRIGSDETEEDDQDVCDGMDVAKVARKALMAQRKFASNVVPRHLQCDLNMNNNNSNINHNIPTALDEETKSTGVVPRRKSGSKVSMGVV